MSVEIIPAVYSDVVFIARNIRKEDAEEIYPLMFSPTPENLAVSTLHHQISKVALKDGEPVSVFGAGEHMPKFWKVFMFASAKWPTVALSVTKNIIRDVMPTMIDTGAVRADCWSIESHHQAHQWLETLGAVRESSLEDYSSNRKTYYCYSWTRTRLEKENVSFNVYAETAENAPNKYAGTTRSPRGSSNKGRSGSECGSSSGKTTAFSSQRPSIDNRHRANG
jgi:hypothetical protein